MLKWLAIQQQDIDNIFTNLKKYIKKDTKIGIGVSGWPDSIFVSCLIFIFFRAMKFDFGNIFWIHLNHSTRNNNSKEQIFVKDFFKWFNLKVVVRGFSKNHTENSMRKRRFKQFQNFIEENKLEFFVLWHNLTDRIETTFLNLIRGCDLNGFLSMSFYEKHYLLSDVGVIRPLLSFTKEEILNFVNESKLPFVVDESNLDNSVSKRNFLRNEVFPRLLSVSDKKEKFFQSLLDIYTNLESRFYDDIEFLDIEKSKYWNAEFAYELIFKAKITTNSIVVLLKKLGLYQNIYKSFIKELYNFFIKNNSSYKYFNWVYFFISHGRFYAIKATKNFWNNNFSKNLFVAEDNVNFDGFNFFDLNDFLWKEIRYANSWDVFGSQNLSRWFIKNKIPIFWRNFIPVLVDWKKVLKVFDSVLKSYS